MASRISTSTSKSADIIQQIKAISGRQKTASRLKSVEELLLKLHNKGTVLPPSIKKRVSEWKEESAAVSAQVTHAVTPFFTPPCEPVVLGLAQSVLRSFSPEGSALGEIDMSSNSLHRSATSRAAINKGLLISAYGIMRRVYGPSKSYIPFLISQTLRLSILWAGRSSFKRDERAIELMENALCSRRSSLEDQRVRFYQYFEYMLTNLQKNNPSFDRTIFLLGVHACEVGDLSIIFDPVEDVLGVDSRQKAAESLFFGSLSTPEFLNQEYLRRSYQSGCVSAYHVFNRIIDLGNVIDMVLISKLQFYCSFIHPQAIELIKEIKSQKLAKVLTNLNKVPIFQDLSTQARVSLFLEMRSMHQELIGPDMVLRDLFEQFLHYYDGHVSNVVSIKSSRGSVSEVEEEKPLHQEFIFLTENSDTLLTFRSQVFAYLDEMIENLEKSIHNRKISMIACSVYLDRSVDWSIVASLGFIPFLNQYEKSCPQLNLTGLPGDIRSVPAQELEEIQHGKTILDILRVIRDEFKKVGDVYAEDFIRLAALHKAGLVSITKAEEVLFNIPSTSGILDDGMGNKVLLPPLPPSQAGVASLSLDSVKEVVDVHGSSREDSPAASILDHSPTLTVSEGYSEDDLVWKSFTELNSILTKARVHNRFDSRPAKEAFLNALHYAEALCLLISNLKGTVDAHHLAYAQQDIATAAFYACEQLLTAILNEKLKGKKESFVKSRYKIIGHRLMGRFLEAGLSSRKELNVIVPSLRKLERVGANVLNPFSPCISHPLLTNLKFLLSKGYMVAEPEEIRNVLFSGQEILEVFFRLLVSEGIDAGVYAGTIDACLSDIKRVSMPAVTKPEISIPSCAKVSTVAEKIPPKANPFFHMLDIIGKALDSSAVFDVTEKRRSAIMHNLTRLNYLKDALDDPAMLPLVPFHGNQIRFIIRNVLEEFLCAACEHKNKLGSDSEREVKHDLAVLASHIDLFNRLDANEKTFLKKSKSDRNEARYGFKNQSHSGMGLAETTPVIESAAGSAKATDAEEAIGDFTYVVVGSYQRIHQQIADEITMVHALCRKIADYFDSAQVGESGF